MNTEDLQRVIDQHLTASHRLATPIDLKRGVATIPLSGIDVPFHSTYLRGGIDTYRRYLREKVLAQNINPDQLVGKWIPNVMGKPFSVERWYVEEVAERTGSAPLRQMLEGVSENLRHRSRSSAN